MSIISQMLSSITPTGSVSTIASVGTSLLLHFDDPVGSSIFTDSSVYGNQLTAVNGAVISGTSKFGTGALFLDGVNDYVTVPKTPETDISSGDFTIEGWFLSPAVPGTGTRAIYSMDALQSYTGLIISVNSARQFLVTMSYTGNSWSQLFKVFGTFTLNTWNHWAVVREGSVLRAYFNGVLGLTITGLPAVLYTQSGPFGFGKYSTTYLSGYLDEVRLVKGIALYSNNFAVPETPFAIA